MKGKVRGSEQPSKPSYRFVGDAPPAALAHLRDKAVWLTWDFVWKADKGKWAKPPHSASTGRMQKDWANAPGFVSTFGQALATMRKRRLAGIGISLGHAGLAGVDLDDCISDADTFTPLAAQAIGFGETYCEVSPSGEGVHFLALPVERTIKRDDLKVELYHQGRYFTVTGRKVEDAPDAIREAPRLIAHLAQLDAETPKPGKESAPIAAKPVGDFFVNVNAAALTHLDRWVPVLHPTAKKQGTGAWRVTAASLGRDLEEDVSYHPEGIQDFGEEHGLSPIDAVIGFGTASKPTEAAQWLCRQMGVEPAALGWGKPGERPGDDRAHATARTETQPDRDAVDVRPWPVLPEAAMRGLAGEFARIATEGSEADPIAVMMTAMTGIGALMGRARFIRVGDTEHYPCLMCALVGATARARKGTSWGPVRRLLARTEEIIHDNSTIPHPLGLQMQITRGPLSSAEGLVAAIRDRQGEDDEGGTDDKRLLVVEGEFGSALRAMERPGNTLSMMLRTAWDGHQLAPLIKDNRTIASDPHICIVAHITRQELKDLMSASDVWGGLANRLLWICVRRRALVPVPQGVDDRDMDRIAQELARVAIHANNKALQLRLTNAAQDHWAAVYPELSQDHPGLLGAATARAEAQVIRLALTYALIDGADRIEIDHLEAGLAMWRYAEDSAAYLFGGAEMNPVAQTVLRLLATGAKTRATSATRSAGT